MLKLIAPVLLMICPVFSIAQAALADSLEYVLKTRAGKDTSQVKLLNDLAFEYNFTNPQKGIETAKKALALAIEIQYQPGVASSYSNMGVNYAATGDDSLALLCYNKALDIHTQRNNLQGMAKVYNNIAIVYVGKGRYAEALENHKKTYTIWEQFGNKQQMANSLNNSGVVHLYLSNYPAALRYYLRALSLLSGIDNDVAIANCLTNIGIVYKSLTDYSKSLEYHRKALAIYQAKQNTQGIANTLGNIGVSLDKQGNHLAAIDHYEQALAINRKLGNSKRIASDLINIGVAQENCKNYKLSRQYLADALILTGSSGDKNTEVIVLNQLAALLVNAPNTAFSEQLSDRLLMAEKYLQRSLVIAEQLGSPDRISETWKHLTALYEKQGAYRDAIAAYKNHIVYRDSIYNSEVKKKVARAEVEAEFEKKELLSAAQIKEERFRRRSIMTFSIVIIAALISGFILYKRKLDADKRQKAAAFAAEKAENEMKVLRLQMNPHFIFNALGSINDFILKNEPAEAGRYLTKFGQLMRSTLENSEYQEITLGEELQNLENYMQLEATRFKKRFSYQVNIEPGLDKEVILVPPMILQPFVENSIIHGFSPRNGAGNIAVNIFTRGQLLHCQVKDDGVGAEAVAGKTHGNEGKKSMAFKITKERLELLNRRHYQSPVLASVSSTYGEAGTIVDISLPIQQIE